MPRPAKATRENFEAGKVDSWTAGGYRFAVQVIRVRDALKLRWKDPASGRRRQATASEVDSKELRKRATAEAVALSEGLRAGKVAAVEAGPPKADALTLEDACLLYMQGRAPGFTREMLDWGPAKIRAWFAELPDAVRQEAPDVETLNKDLRSFRGLWSNPHFERSRKVRDIEPGDWRAAQQELLTSYSPRTLANWRDRLSVVLRDIRFNHRKSVGLSENPMDGAKAVRTKARIPRYTDEERAKLRAEAKKAMEGGAYWRIWTLLAFAHSGRRTTAMLHLCDADHDREAGTVTWRSKWAKAENYGKPDEVRTMTELHARVLQWVTEAHPNPRGPEYPIIWSEKDPTRPASYMTLLGQWHRLEKAAEVETIRQRAFHSMRRAIVTLISEELGVEVAADFVGMTPQTANSFFYRQMSESAMQRAAGAINQEFTHGSENE